jgi:hypothetical protein
MGMYDYVNFAMNCPNCGAEVDGFQSKSGPCTLSFIDPQETTNFYSACSRCGTLYEFIKKYEFPYSTNEREHCGTYTLGEVAALGFIMKVTFSEQPSEKQYSHYFGINKELLLGLLDMKSNTPQ